MYMVNETKASGGKIHSTFHFTKNQKRVYNSSLLTPNGEICKHSERKCAMSL